MCLRERVCVFKWEFYYILCVCVCVEHRQCQSHTYTHIRPFFSSSPFFYFLWFNTDSLTHWSTHIQPITLNEKMYFVIIYFLTLTIPYVRIRRRHHHCHCCRRHTNDEQLWNLSVCINLIRYRALCYIAIHSISFSFIRSVASAIQLLF